MDMFLDFQYALNKWKRKKIANMFMYIFHSFDNMVMASYDTDQQTTAASLI